MKRSCGIHLFISSVLIMTASCTFAFAMYEASLFYGVECMVVTVAGILNMACGYDKNERK